MFHARCYVCSARDVWRRPLQKNANSNPAHALVVASRFAIDMQDIRSYKGRPWNELADTLCRLASQMELAIYGDSAATAPGRCKQKKVRYWHKLL